MYNVWIVIAGEAWDNRDSQSGWERSDRVVCACLDESVARQLVVRLNANLQLRNTFAGADNRADAQKHVDIIRELDPKAVSGLYHEKTAYRFESLRIHR